MLWNVIQSSAIIVGLGLAAVGFAGRTLLRSAPAMTTKFNEIIKQFPMDTEVLIIIQDVLFKKRLNNVHEHVYSLFLEASIIKVVLMPKCPKEKHL